MTVNTYGVSSNKHLPPWMTNQDELHSAPYVGISPSKIKEDMSLIQYGGHNKSLWYRYNKYDSTTDLEAPLNRGGIRWNKVYDEGSFGQTFLRNLSSSPQIPESKMKPVLSNTRSKPLYNSVL